MNKTWPALFPTLTVLLLLGPVLAGFLGTVLPSVGLLRPEGGSQFSLGPWVRLTAWPGLSSSVWLTFKTGFLSSLFAFLLAVLLVAGWQGTRWYKLAHGLLSPLLSLPHTAAALGLAFLIAPSGWIARLFSPWATGWERPPDLLILHDPGGWSLILGLVLKELPFLLLMMISAMPQLQPGKRVNVAAALGYGRVFGWCFTVLPGVYMQIRLPIYAVLAYAMSNVDMALVLGPTTPSVLSVRILEAVNDPDLSQRATAAAAALVQLGLVLFAIATWRVGERCVATMGRWLLWRGFRGTSAANAGLRSVGFLGAGLSAAALFIGLLQHGMWSVSGRWRFPDIAPESFKLRNWERASEDLITTTSLTLWLALAVGLIALVLAIGCLETEQRGKKPMQAGSLTILYLPLLLPQISFLPGLQILLLLAGVDHGLGPVALAHLVFVLPYVFLTLAGPFRAWDHRLATVAASLGKGPLQILWSLKLPMLLAPMMTALAIGMSVSIGQYLPTLLVSGGRVDTLTTEAIALASGGDRRSIGVWAITLTSAAWLPFFFAYAIPTLWFQNRRDMKHG